jgi:NADH dehydrogenase FAD-containing subunit
MKSLFSKLFGKAITFTDSKKTFACVLDANKKSKENELFYGNVKSIDFDKRVVVITDVEDYTLAERNVHTISFDRIVSINRMRDGRLRLWINTED